MLHKSREGQRAARGTLLTCASRLPLRRWPADSHVHSGRLSTARPERAAGGESLPSADRSPLSDRDAGPQRGPRQTALVYMTGDPRPDQKPRSGLAASGAILLGNRKYLFSPDRRLGLRAGYRGGGVRTEEDRSGIGLTFLRSDQLCFRHLLTNRHARSHSSNLPCSPKPGDVSKGSPAPSHLCRGVLLRHLICMCSVPQPALILSSEKTCPACSSQCEVCEDTREDSVYKSPGEPC
ncbi:hypothetical protein AAFF_G00049840 [Aldrovandia affinis]|uniref:Uncharacterized protein n=1 Tax=Aldrovandia affinis TaxID=143900 RepID=A0AAD7S1A6_9TELE|nr:hypothetical protein AAFF_G00049840 [Aldrovandia affinis]